MYSNYYICACACFLFALYTIFTARLELQIVSVIILLAFMSKIIDSYTMYSEWCFFFTVSVKGYLFEVLLSIYSIEKVYHTVP